MQSMSWYKIKNEIFNNILTTDKLFCQFAEDGAPAEWGGEVAVVILNTSALIEAALILRTSKALLVSDTLTMVRGASLYYFCSSVWKLRSGDGWRWVNRCLWHNLVRRASSDCGLLYVIEYSGNQISPFRDGVCMSIFFCVKIHVKFPARLHV